MNFPSELFFGCFFMPVQKGSASAEWNMMSSENSTKLATIDIGSNSIVLLIAQCFPDGTIVFLDEHYALTKLGADVKMKRVLSDEAVQHTIAAVKELKKLAEYEEVDEIIVTTSSAVRMAENRNRFLVKCYQEIGIFPQVLSGKEEAEYTFFGATTDLDTEKPVITIDVGGGSTEISWGTTDSMEAGYSLDIGCVSLNEEFDLGERYMLYKRLSAVHYLRKEFAKIAEPMLRWKGDNKALIIATGGSITTYAAIQNKIEVYNRSRINLVKGRRKELSMVCRKLARMNIQARRRVPGMIMDRVYDLPAGLMITTEFLRYFHFKRFLISSYGLRAGILKHYAEKYRRKPVPLS